jgi:beta-lactam-binding protein with PASTA domain
MKKVAEKSTESQSNLVIKSIPSAGKKINKDEDYQLGNLF